MLVRSCCSAVLVSAALSATLASAQSAPGSSAADGRALAPELNGLGSLTYTVTTRAAGAQKFFDQGLRLLYAFNHTEALRAFREAARLDPALAMAYWGQAMALAPNLNAPLTADNARLAYGAVQRAREQAAAATDRERALIDALATRFAASPAADRKGLDRAYAEAMATAARRYRDDPEVQTLYADAVMNTIPWDYWRKDGSLKPELAPAQTALERVIAAHPDHPGAHHYYIHLLEGSNDPDRAVPSADKLGSLMPAAGHMVHMPAHIYLRVGRYADAAEANIRAIAADEDYLAQCQAQGLYPISYYPHNLHFLWAAATLEGRSAVAVDAARNVAAKVPHHHAGALSWTADFPVTPWLAYVRFGLWRHMLTEPAPPSNEPYATGIWHYGRGLAYIAQGRFDRADRELAALRTVMEHEAFRTTLKDLPLLTNLQIASRVLEGELAARRGQADEAVRVLTEAVAVEDGLPYNEPPVWHQPVRQVLGAVLLEAGRAKDAEQIYRADLERVRENGWSLAGLAQSLEAQQRRDEASAVRQRFERAWQRADITISTSRILDGEPRRLPATSRATGLATSQPEQSSIMLATGVTLRYVERGDRSGTPVILLHGYTDSWRSFELVMPHLPDSLRVFAVSQRGHGDSDRPVQGYGADAFAADIAAFLDALDIRSAIVVGHSMGAQNAMRFALDYPERTRGLVLVGAFTPGYENPAVRELSAVITRLKDPIDRAFVRDFQTSTIAGSVPSGFLDRVVDESLKVPASVWKSVLESFRSSAAAIEAGRIRVPTLLVSGGKDALIPDVEQRALAARIPASTSLVYANAGHAVHWEDPERFARDLTAFARSVVADAQ